MFAKTKYKRLVWLLISIGVANGIAEATKQGSSCKRPAKIANADLKPEYDGQSEFNDEAFVEYDCIIGYSIEGTSRKRVCNNGQWSPILFTCYEITCSYVDSPEHGKRLDASNSIGEYTYFKCDTGYKLTGPDKLWCRANGEWLPPDPPTCEPILCPEVPSIRYGRTFQDSSDGMRNDYQSVTKYTCNSGYMLEGNNGQDSRECQADGTWSGEEPKCTTPRCKHIGPFYGGDVQYFGDRERWTFAFYRCNEGYHMSPSNVKRSECTDDLEWDPTPPQCFQMAKVYVPENGYYRGNKGNLLHGESYVIQCKNKYEMHSEEGGFINLKSLPIRNNNGSLEPTVPKCLEKRCDPADQYKTIVKYPNGVRVTSKILSQTTVRLECEQGYEYYRDNAPMETSVIRKCVKGNIENAPVCDEARCLVSGYPRNKDTRYRNYRTKYVLDEGQYMRPKNKLEVVCVNEADYELFVNSTGKYLKSFTSECRFGLFDKEAEEFPICLEKRCNPADQYKTIVKYTNGLHVTSKILSQTTVRLECEQGYDYYRDNVPMKTPVIRKCVKGNIENAPVCEEARCLVSGYPRNKDTRYRNYRTKYVFAEGQYMRPNNKLEVVCVKEADYELFVNSTGKYLESFTSDCRFGLFNREAEEFPICLEKRCDPADQHKTIVKYPNGVLVTSKILSQTTVKLECEPGYDYYRVSTPMETPVMRKCVKGNIENAPVCEEARCLVSGYPKNKDTEYRYYQTDYVLVEGHYMRPNNKLEVVCVNEADYELFVNSTGKYLKSFTSECKFGLFDREAEEFPICLEKRCDPVDQNKAIVKYTNGSRVTSKLLSRTTVTLECEQGYDFYMGNKPIETPVTRMCVKGNIENAPVCEEERCLVSGYPRNKHTDHRYLWPVDGDYMRPNNKLEVVCTNGTYYELYVNSTATYLESFTSECRYGRLDKEAETFPICLERRCIFKPSQHACFTTNKKEDCISGEFKVPSRKSVTIKCRKGYTLYLSKDGTSKHVKDEEQVTCLKGAYFQGYKCIPDSKVQAIKDYFFKIKDKITKGFETILDRFTCSSSLSGSNFCEDPCLVPDVQFGFAKNEFGDRVSMEVVHGTQITIGCDNGYDPSENVTSTCKSGDWDIEQFPFCIPKPCHISVNIKTIFWVNSAQLVVGDGIKRTFRNGTKIEMLCANGYEMKESSTGKTINESRKDIVCILGNWSKSYTCKAAQCSVPQVKNAVLKTKSANKYDHWSEIRFRCNGGHHFSENENKIRRGIKAQCRFGNWSRSIPAKCRPDSCQLKIHEGSNYSYNSVLVETSTKFPHGTHVGLQCLDNFDTFDEEGNIIDIYPNITCYQGIWKNMYTCKKRCNTFGSRNGENMYKVKNISTDQAVLHGERIMVSCAGHQENDFELKCDNGEWKGYVDCNDKKNITNAGAISEHVDGCLLPSDKKFSFRDDNDNDVPVGSLVESGTTLTVTCAYIDYYELLTSYDYYDDGTNETTITCTGKELSRFDLDCPDVEPDSCLELHNGIVKKVFNKYYVSCEEGFSLNLIKQENAECTCQNGKLKSVIGHQDPNCIPNDCVLPYDIDDKLSVKDRSRFISLSPGSTVTSGDHVFLNCSKVSEHIYEPLNRRFKCVEGQWIEDENDPNWKFGNNGTFPICRKAICEPNCANEGVCYKDDHCKCKRLTEGKRCEIVRCDEQCTENGGECVAAGKCVCPKGRHGPSCEKKSCRLPENSAKPKVPRIMYNIGDKLKDLECDLGYIVDSKDSMTCQENGSWSNIVHCVKSVVYLISVKTDDARLTFGEGTDAHVYIYLHGRRGNTNKINLIGSFENNDLDETRVEEKDIRPITGIAIGHDGAGFNPDWLLKFVSIYVESMNEYYVFRYDNSVWVTASKDVPLPLKDNCVKAFDEGHNWYPRWENMDGRRYFIGRNGGMSLRGCQQKCTELTNFQCFSVLYDRRQKACWGFSTDDERYFHANRENWDSLIYRRYCKENI